MIRLALKDAIAKRSMLVLLVFSFLILLVLLGLLALRAKLILQNHSLIELLFSTDWRPNHEKFGLRSFILSTLTITTCAAFFSLPVCFFTTIFLAYYSPNWVRKMFLPMLELLAGIPPIIFGVWGVLLIVPLSKNIGLLFGNFSQNGFSIFAGALVLSLMVAPMMISLMLEVLNTIPEGYLQASLSVGASHWQTIKHVVLPKTAGGLLAALVLAVSRALGETVAVLMVCGNVMRTPHSVFDACYPLTALVANNYGEILSIPLCGSALMFAALVLVVIILIFNAMARVVLYRIEREIQL